MRRLILAGVLALAPVAAHSQSMGGVLGGTGALNYTWHKATFCASGCDYSGTTWTVPSSGVEVVWIDLVGGGGGGGGGNAAGGAGGGGAGGTYIPNMAMPVVAGATLTITVGSGGVGGAVGSNGTAGTASYVSGGAASIASL